MPALEHLPADTPAADLERVLRRDGALILDAALSTARVDALVAELSPYVAATPRGAMCSAASAPRAPARWWPAPRSPAS